MTDAAHPVSDQPQPWHRQPVAAAIAHFAVDPIQGLSTDEAAQRLAQFGRNAIRNRALRSPWRIWLDQFASTVVVVLLVAAAIAATLGSYRDAVAILMVVLLNALLGFVQENRAERAIAQLQALDVPTAWVRRDGTWQEIPAADLVPGDIIAIAAGSRIPADGRLLESVQLQTQEASLTGEAEAVAKHSEALPDGDTALGDRANMVYANTLAIAGRGVAIVTATGMATEFGKVAALMQAVGSEPTPLQRRLDDLGRVLAIACVGVAIAFFAVGVWRGESAQAMLLTAISLAVAALPEGLPAVVTIALALAAQRMLARHVLIRRLTAVETLGSVSTICADKTGTLTENRMSVAAIDVADGSVALSPTASGEQDNPSLQQAVARVLLAGALCGDAVADPATQAIVGTPTEVAIARTALQYGWSPIEVAQWLPRVAELPFDRDRRCMTTIHTLTLLDGACTLPACDRLQPLHPLLPQTAIAGSYLAFTKGALEAVLDRCDRLWMTAGIVPLDPATRDRLLAVGEARAAAGMRVLGIACREVADPRDPAIESHLIFLGAIGAIDPLRPEVSHAVPLCRSAGIRPLVITGDHPLTAAAIAQQAGIASDRILTGSELDALTEAALIETVATTAIYARVTPAHKLRIVRALQQRGETVAMTGDGINDAPALRQADIGIAMGITGTAVSREASDIVLLDDNFASIVAAVEEGRVAYDNLRKFVKYLAVSNVGELWVLILAFPLGMPVPLLPLQILWLNLAGDGLPALALGLEPPEADAMSRPPQRAADTLFDRAMTQDILWIGLLTGLLSLGVGYAYWLADRPEWQAMLFNTLIFGELGLALAARSETQSFIALGVATNPLLLGAVFATAIAQIAVLYLPVGQSLLHTYPLPLPDLLLSVAASAIVGGALELEKWWVRRRSPLP